MGAASVAADRFKAIVEDMKYKPNWCFDTHWTGGFFTFRLVSLEPDVEVAGKSVGIQLDRPVPDHILDCLFRTPEKGAVWAKMFIEACIREKEEHEMKEWLKFGGVRVSEPHPTKPDDERPF